MVALFGNGWRLAKSLVALEQEIDALWPRRDHASDGSIGDLAHQNEGHPYYNAQGYATSGSDHNPDSNGVVCALDVDSGPGIDPNELVAAITLEPDPRIAYVIWNRHIFSNQEGSTPWQWRPYGGADPHINHVHVSVRHGAIADDETPWAIEASPQPTGGHVVAYMIQDDRGNVASTDFQTKRALGGQQSAAMQQAKKDAGEPVIITHVGNAVYDAIPDSH